LSSAATPFGKGPWRQSYEASQAIIRLHEIYPERVILAQQNPRAIDAGVFHNDVISVGNQNVFIYHEAAFVGKEQVIEQIRRKVAEQADTEMIFFEIPERKVSLGDAVASYFFNSQLITRNDDSMILVAPSECQEIPSVENAIEEIIGNRSNPITQVHYFNLHESMRNGGGPACLRLRVVLDEKELQAMHKEVLLTDNLYKKLTNWINKHYRDRLRPEDLADPHLLIEVREALQELTKILNLGPIYPFQQ
jgi:succinylarginine dihydrolase